MRVPDSLTGILIERQLLRTRIVPKAVLAEHHQRFIDGNAHQPGGELRFAFKLANLVEGFAEDVLRVVFRILAVLQYFEGGSVNPAGVSADANCALALATVGGIADELSLSAVVASTGASFLSASFLSDGFCATAPDLR